MSAPTPAAIREFAACQRALHERAAERMREASEWESPRETALRVVLPKTATFAGHQGGLA